MVRDALERGVALVQIAPHSQQADAAGTMYLALATMSLAAAGIHFAVIDEHFKEYVAFGIFFAAVAWFQAVWAVGVAMQPARWLLVMGSFGNLAVAIVWLASRTAGLPIGPEPGAAEAASAIDVLSTVLEVLLALGCATLSIRQRSFSSLRNPKAFAPLGVFVAVVAVATTAAIVAAPAERDHTTKHGSVQHMDHRG